MILITMGTQDKKFNRLLKAIDEEVKKGNIKDEIIVQGGCSSIKTNNMKIYKSFPMDEFQDLVSKCDLLITHGGVGSITTGLKFGKKIIAVPRLTEYGENTNDHQVQIVSNFSEAGYIIGLTDLNNLDEALEKAKKFKPKKFKSNTENMINLIDKFISKL